MNRFISKCPACGGDLVVTRLHCPQCDTTIEGSFYPPSNPLSQLTPDQVQFVLAFVRCEGRFTRLEDELKLSYPTLRNRLNDIIRAMGFEPGREEPPVPPAAARPTFDERRRILEDLEKGQIPFEEAQRRLQGKLAEGPEA
jgi:hypothetical protein